MSEQKLNKSSSNNKSIAKNTIFLYIRTMIIMVVSLYTSRVILNSLGIENYGIYNAVGGVVSMLSFMTAALSAAISRYITYEIGKNGNENSRLRIIFSTSIRIQVSLGLLVVIIGETIGIWFLNTFMNIPDGRMLAANWVWQCCLVTFFINLISVPYNALIIAHEHMNAFAMVSILEAVLKLLICYLLVASPMDRLISYAILLAFVSLFIRFTYGIYCRKHFEECKYTSQKDKGLARDMFSFAGFSFLNNSVSILNNQGIGVLVNIFFGVTFNAARGVASQIEGLILQLVNNITVAINPQITKSYASGDNERMFELICKGAKYSYFLLLLLTLPIYIEAEYILKIWLKTVPPYSVLFFRLSIIGTMLKMIGMTGYTACMATGDIKKYSTWVFIFGITAFPLTWIAYTCGFPVEYAYYAYILAYFMIEIVRMILMKNMLNFPPSQFIKEVVLKAIIVTIASTWLPFYLHTCSLDSNLRLIIVVLTTFLTTLISIYFMGLSKAERYFVVNVMHRFLKILPK